MKMVKRKIYFPSVGNQEMEILEDDEALKESILSLY